MNRDLYFWSALLRDHDQHVNEGDIPFPTLAPRIAVLRLHRTADQTCLREVIIPDGAVAVWVRRRAMVVMGAQAGQNWTGLGWRGATGERYWFYGDSDGAAVETTDFGAV